MTRSTAQQVSSYNLLKNNVFYSFVRENLRGVFTWDELAVYALFGLILTGSLVLLAINLFFFQFTIWSVGTGLFTSLPILLGIWWFIGQIHRKKWPRFGVIAVACAQTAAFVIVSTIGCVAILTTPFVIVDYHLIAFDRALGFNVIGFMAWVHQYPVLVKILSLSYDSWYIQIILTPVALAALKKSKEINRYFIGISACFIFCALIYYFFPTIAPAGVMHSPYFLDNQYHLVTRFYEIHQRLPISVFDGGVVAFPSCHVMFCLFVLIAWRHIKIVFYPLLVINFFLILGTMGLGYHYLVDVLLGFVLVAMTLGTARLLGSRFA